MAVKHITSVEEFNTILAGNKKVVIDFFAEWCGPCKMLGPIFEEVASSDTNYEFLKVNVDEMTDLAEKYAVASIPTLVISEKSKEVKRHTGFLTKDQLVEFLK